jgi:hypothetical protein
MCSRLILAAAFIFLTATAWAHGTGQHVLGTVTAIDDKHLEIKTPKGAVVRVELNKSTRFKDKKDPKATQPPSVGDRVVVEATKENKILTATEVIYASAKAAAPPVPASQQPAAAAPAH